MNLEMQKDKKVLQISERLDEPEWLKKLRKESFDYFEKLDKPLFKYGLSLYMPIRGAKLEEVNPRHALQEKIEVKNSTDAVVMNVQDALKKDEYKELIEQYWMQKAYYLGENKITAMHGAFWAKGLFIYVPEGVECEETIKIEMNMKEQHSLSHILVIAEENSKAHITEVSKSEGLSYGLKSHGVEAFLKEGSEITYESLQDLNTNVWHFSTKRAVLDNNACINWFTGTMGAKHSKVEVSADLAGSGSQSNNYGVFMGTGKQEFDTYNTVVHSEPHTDSDMDNKGIVKDRAKSVYRGLVKVKEKAHDSNGYQKEDTLILSDYAEADAVPNLEIENNDVRCSHGATIGQVDKEKLFYMQTRGLSRKEAEREIVKGFLGSMINRVKSEQLREEMEGLVVRRLS